MLPPGVRALERRPRLLAARGSAPLRRAHCGGFGRLQGPAATPVAAYRCAVPLPPPCAGARGAQVAAM